MARGREYARKRVAEHRSPGVAHVDRARRVDADELDLHAFPGRSRSVAEFAARGTDGLNARRKPSGRHAYIYEPRAGHLGALKEAVRVKALGQSGRDLARVHTHLPRQLERDAGSEVAVRRVLGTLNGQVFHVGIGQGAGLLRIEQGGTEPGLHFLADVQLRHRGSKAPRIFAGRQAQQGFRFRLSRRLHPHRTHRGGPAGRPSNDEAPPSAARRTFEGRPAEAGPTR